MSAPQPRRRPLATAHRGNAASSIRAQSRRGESSDPKAAAALRFARGVALQRGHVSDAELKAVRDAGYGEAEAIEIVMQVGMNSRTNYVNEVAKTDIDFPVATAQAA